MRRAYRTVDAPSIQGFSCLSWIPPSVLHSIRSASTGLMEVPRLTRIVPRARVSLISSECVLIELRCSRTRMRYRSRLLRGVFIYGQRGSRSNAFASETATRRAHFLRICAEGLWRKTCFENWQTLAPRNPYAETAF